MTGAPRFELKYRLGLPQYLSLKSAIAPLARLDQHSRATPEKRYLVRSLYFDTYDLQAYCEKMTGEVGRVKLRLRSYFAERASVPFVNVEIKARLGAQVSKFSTRVSPDQVDHFLRHRHWLVSAPDAVLDEFERRCRLRNMRPVVLVEYWREAYVARDADGVRITFDHDLRAAFARDLFPESCIYRRGPAHSVVLEIKFDGDAPDWLQRLAVRHGLKTIPNSKYAQCLERTLPAMVRM
jgi:SPX domain protein involved in polyphosphate accumulation